MQRKWKEVLRISIVFAFLIVNFQNCAGPGSFSTADQSSSQSGDPASQAQPSPEPQPNSQPTLRPQPLPEPNPRPAPNPNSQPQPAPQPQPMPSPTPTPLSCLFQGQTIASGQSVTAYQAANVPFGQTCVSQTRTCTNGVLSGTYLYASCSVAAPANCSFNGKTVLHGQSVMAYQASTVASGQTCQSESRVCTNGALSGTYQYAACTAMEPIPSVSCNFNVSTLAQFKSSLSLAKSGQVICLADSAVIDLTNESTLTIPGGVTLRSGRGSAIPASGASLGGKIKTAATIARPPLLQTGGDGVKIIGVRFEGPLRDPKAEEGRTMIAAGMTNAFHGKYATRGILIRHNRTLIEFSEAYGFGHYAITVSAGVDNIIRDSFLHHNQLYGLGYGVMTTGASKTLITKNIFDFNRHAIASTGATGNEYEASYNISYRHHTELRANHEFDVHGQGDTDGQHSGGIAGSFFSIHHNTFYLGSAKAFLLRGYPTNGIRIYNNRAVHSSFATAFEGRGGGEVAIQENMSFNIGNIFSIGQPSSYPQYPLSIYPAFN